MSENETHIPEYAKPLSPGRRLEGPPERFTPRAVYSTYVGKVWNVWDRQLNRAFVTCTGATVFFGEGSALACCRNLNRGEV